jgi:hypothetical protein
MFLPSHRVASRKSANREVGKSAGRELSEGFLTQTTLCGLQPIGENFWEGRVASSEWRMANGFDHPQSKRQRMANSEREWQLAISDWWMTFLEGRKWEGEIPAEPKRQRVANGE